MNPSRESESLYLYVPNGPSVDKMKNPIIDVAVRRQRRISEAGGSSVETTEALGSPRVDRLVVLSSSLWRWIDATLLTPV